MVTTIISSSIINTYLGNFKYTNNYDYYESCSQIHSYIFILFQKKCPVSIPIFFYKR